VGTNVNNQSNNLFVLILDDTISTGLTYFKVLIDRMKLILNLLILSSVVAWQATTRRVFVDTGIASILAAPIVSAAIDVSAIAVDGSSSSSGNNSIRDQLKKVDGSGAARIREIRENSMQTTSKIIPGQTETTITQKPSSMTTATTLTTPSIPPISSKVSSFAMRYGSNTRLTKRGLEKYNYKDYVFNGNSGGKVTVEFEFPSDWLQLDKLSGGIQYVDQRNGDKLYVLTVALPEGETLESASKLFFADAIFDSEGAIVRSGSTVDEYKVGRSEIVSINRRRLTMKYATVTGNGLRVERRGLVDAQAINGQVYMLMTSSNAAKFEAKGRERETVEAIVDSFRCDLI